MAQRPRPMRSIEADLEQIEKQLSALRQQNTLLNEHIEKLQTITSVGVVAALGVLAKFPELGTLNRYQSAALVRLAPHPRISRNWQGRRAIGSGRSSVRRALYMAALVAAQSSRQLKDFINAGYLR